MPNPQKPFSESGNSPPIRVTVTSISRVPGSTAGNGVGHDANGNEVTFRLDWRPAFALADALEAGEFVEVILAGRQVLAYRRAAR